MKRYSNSTWQKEYIYTTTFQGRAVPIVILANGKPGFLINQWIYWLLEEDITPRLLDRHIRSIMQLYEFHYRTYRDCAPTKNQAENLLKDFLEAKRNGSWLMGWKPIAKKTTLQGYLNSINLFDKWHSTFHGAIRMNPSEDKLMNSWEIYQDFKSRENWDPMLHLFPAKSHKRNTYEHELKIGHKRFLYGKKIIPKAFPVNRFVELVEHTPNPRDQMLFLLMGGGGLRKSELLHLYYEDVLGIDESGSTRIRLDDPEVGEISWQDNKGKLKTGTRTEYLANKYKNEQFRETIPDLYNLSPRTNASKRMQAGFKGMTFSTQGKEEYTTDGRITHTNELFWCDPRFGTRFQKAFEAYRERYYNNKSSQWPFHPYLFININEKDDGYGLPMTMNALNKAWKRALKRIGMQDCGLGEHSLRHMYGGYCASVLELPLETTRTLMHHGSITSTEVYYHLKQEDVKKAIFLAVKENVGVSILDHVIMPHTSKIQTPDTWSL